MSTAITLALIGAIIFCAYCAADWFWPEDY